MHITLLIMDLVGTIAFAISGAVLGIKKKMDIFGISLLAITTACGGGILRDI
ncbi:MAG: TRIC cation channel family protein, partial [Pseudobutyrivibrio sp.]|nr:TRIC cation channel family protein [Pseudobutyrivibrio sp.]